MKRVVNILAATVALIGLTVSFYLILEHYGLVNSEAALMSGACPIETDACAIVTESPDSAILGIPYSVIGGLYFFALLGVSIFRIYRDKWPAPRLLTVYLVGGLVFSTYLMYVMYYVQREVCPYCVATHISNAVFFILFGWSLHNDASAGERRFTRSILQH